MIFDGKKESFPNVEKEEEKKTDLWHTNGQNLCENFRFFFNFHFFGCLSIHLFSRTGSIDRQDRSIDFVCLFPFLNRKNTEKLSTFSSKQEKKWTKSLFKWIIEYHLPKQTNKPTNKNRFFCYQKEIFPGKMFISREKCAFSWW